MDHSACRHTRRIRLRHCPVGRFLARSGNELLRDEVRFDSLPCDRMVSCRDPIYRTRKLAFRFVAGVCVCVCLSFFWLFASPSTIWNDRKKNTHQRKKKKTPTFKHRNAKAKQQQQQQRSTSQATRKRAFSSRCLLEKRDATPKQASTKASTQLNKAPFRSRSAIVASRNSRFSHDGLTIRLERCFFFFFSSSHYLSNSNSNNNDLVVVLVEVGQRP